MTQNPDRFAIQLLDRLVELDKQVTSAYYEMGRLLSSLRRDKLYELIGYDSMAELVEEELSFTYSTACRYIMVYDHFQRLKYTKSEAINAINEFGLRHMTQILPKLNQKAGIRALKNRVAEIGDTQISFWMHESEMEELRQALIKMGASELDTGRLSHSSEAVLAMARKINGTKLKAAA
jgi:hypothetical protein